MEEQLFFTINNTVVLLLSFIIAYHVFRNRSLELIALGIGILFPIIILLTVLVLGAFNILYASSVTVLLVPLLLLMVVKPILKFDFLFFRQHVRSILLIGLLLLVGILGGYIAGRYVFTGTHFGFDDFSYHATAAGHWIKDHSIWSGPFNYHYHNPMNAEVLSLWWMLPFGQDGFAFMAGLYWLLLTCLSLFILGGRLGVAPWVRIAVLVAPFVSNIVFAQAFSRFSGVDLAGPAMILASLAFLCFRDTENQESDSSLIIFSGLACGFAIGCKVPFATIALLLFLWILVGYSPKAFLLSRLKDSMLFGLAVLLAGFFWYGKNIYLAGNPVFPGQLGPLAGPLTSEIQNSTKIIGVLVDSEFNWKLLGDLFRQHLCWPTGMGILSLAGYLGAAAWLLFVKHSDKKVVRNLSLLLLAGIVMLLTYVNMPFSGRYNFPGAPIQISLRFVICPFLIGVLLYSVLMAMSGKLKWIFITAFFISIAVALYTAGFVSNCAATVGILGLSFACSMIKSIYLPKQKDIGYVVSLCAGVFLGLSMTFSYQQKRTNSNVFKYANGTTPNGLSWKQIETFKSGTTFATLGPNSYQCYPLLGRHLQYRYKVLDEKGFVSKRLYQRYRQDPDQTLWWPRQKKVVEEPQKFLKNAAQSGVESFVICYDNGFWPISPEDFVDAGWQCVWERKGIMIWQRLK